MLYDTIGTLADNAGQCLAQPGLLALLMPPLMQRWNQVSAFFFVFCLSVGLFLALTLNGDLPIGDIVIARRPLMLVM